MENNTSATLGSLDGDISVGHIPDPASLHTSKYSPYAVQPRAERSMITLHSLPVPQSIQMPKDAKRGFHRA